jgi:CRISPR-associated protein Cas5t
VDAVRIDLHAYTASFRVPGMMGYQLTSPVPPPATIYGLLAAANGREVTPDETWIAYRFEYAAMAQDLETLITYTEKGAEWVQRLYTVKTQPVIRQFLFNPHLVLYLMPGAAAEAFQRPRYPLLLGRSQDVAYVEGFQAVSLEAVGEAQINGVLVPFPAQTVQSQLFSFPTYFEMATRRALAVKPFHVLDFQRGPQSVVIPNLLYREVEGNESLAVPLFNKVLAPA